MFNVAGRTFTLRSQAPAGWFTPLAVLLLVSLATSKAVGLQRDAERVPWALVSITIMVVALAATAECLERLISMPPRQAHWRQLAMFMLVTLLLTSAFLGPFTQGTVRWAAVVIGVPWAVMLWVTVRELIRLLRKRATRSSGETTVSATAH